MSDPNPDFQDWLDAGGADLLTGEPLDPELVEHISEHGGFTMLHHPLVVAIYSDVDVPFLNKQLNGSLRYKREKLEEALIAEDWHTVIWLHERPYRTDAFDEHAFLMDHATYWRLAAEVWIDQENPEDYADEWRGRFTEDRPQRELLMDDNEQEVLATLPEVVTIYRGDISDDPQGLSWSTNRKVAEWFAERFDGNAPVHTATIRREHIAAYWTRRSEDEVLVLDPTQLTPVPTTPSKETP